ncbi:hypothetical protein LUZ60_002203 [Juncus effusus]|nr:hypothetical protein LUZ60_002203 [Juncus effusus]
MSNPPLKIGDRTTSDVVVRIITDSGRDFWMHCHSEILNKNSEYFAKRLSDAWPTCQILDSRYCVEVQCSESEFNSYVNVIRLIYSNQPCCSWFGVRGTLGILRASVYLEMSQLSSLCTDYLESVPWDEHDEEEMLKIIPLMGPQYERILSRLRPVNPLQITRIFISAFRFATSSPNPNLKHELKSCYQEQIEYLLTDDDDSPLIWLENNAVVKLEVKYCVKILLDKFEGFIKIEFGALNELELRNFVSDILWVCQILTKLDMMREIVPNWVNLSQDIVNYVDKSTGVEFEIKLKLVEITARVFESISFGNVILPAVKRLDLMKIWIPYLQTIRVSIEEEKAQNFEVEIWQNLESAIIAIVSTLSLDWQGEILSEWFGSKNLTYPNLIEAFEVWCYRANSTKRRLGKERFCRNGSDQKI